MNDFDLTIDFSVIDTEGITTDVPGSRGLSEFGASCDPGQGGPPPTFPNSGPNPSCVIAIEPA